MRKPRFQPDFILVAILAAAGFLIFWGLGTRDLWEDEAETALLAKNILKFGLPVGFDGLNFVSTEAGKDLGPGFIWSWSPWLQNYVAAGSMAVFGANTLAARLPFACLGFLCLPLSFLLARRLYDSERTARLSAALLALCVPFLLHIRQCRWYAPAYLFVILLLLFLLDMKEERRLGPARYVLCGALLFYTNYFIAIGVVAALLLASPILDPRWRLSKTLFIADLWVAFFALPGILYFDVFGKSGGFAFVRSAGQLWTYSGFFLTFLIPLPVLLLNWGDRRTRFLLAICAYFVAYLSLAPWKVFRYLSVLAPLTAILTAAAADGALKRSKAAGVLLLAVLVFSNALSLIPLELLKTGGTSVADAFPSAGPLRFPILGFLYEITHSLDNCDRAVAEHLKRNAGTKDVVIATYGDLPLQFYTGLKVLGGFQGQKLPADPDWIVMHPFVMDRRPGRDVDVARFILSRVDLSRYRKIALPCVDSVLGNCTEPAAHLYRQPSMGPALTLYRKI